MHTVKLKGLDIKEEKVENSTNTKHKIQQLFKAKKINVFASIDNPLAWQDQQRDEW